MASPIVRSRRSPAARISSPSGASLSPASSLFQEDVWDTTDQLLHQLDVSGEIHYDNVYSEGRTPLMSPPADVEEMITNLPPFVGGEDSDDEDESNLQRAQKDNGMKDRLVNTRTLPSVPKLYGLSREVCGQSESSEKTSKCVFAWHVLFCCINKRPFSYVDPDTASPNQKFGLGLYRPAAFSPNTADCKAYDTKFLGEAFAFLNTYATANIMKKAITFYNAHLRAEYRIRMRAANNPSEANGEAKVGQNSDVKKYLSSALGKRASLAMERCEDLHAAVDTHITDQEIHSKPRAVIHSCAPLLTISNRHFVFPTQPCSSLFSVPCRPGKSHAWKPSTESTLLPPFVPPNRTFAVETSTTVSS